MRKLAVAGFLLLVLSFAYAQSLDRLLIEAEIDKAGNARVTEIYYIRFEGAGEFDGFLEDVSKNGPSLEAWEVDYPWIAPHFGSKAGITAYITFDDSEQMLILNYTIADKFAVVSSEGIRESIWKVPDRQFEKFESGGVLIVPKNVEIKLIVPANARIDVSKLTSQAKVIENSIILNGISTTYVNMLYSVPKPIAPPLDTSELIRQFLSSELNILFIGIVVIIFVVLLWKRKQISGRIEDYVVRHSQVERNEGEEESDRLE